MLLQKLVLQKIKILFRGTLKQKCASEVFLKVPILTFFKIPVRNLYDLFLTFEKLINLFLKILIPKNYYEFIIIYI